ncbi:MAG: PE family protein [Mycobacteriaceae bacterium]|nr:PE family protein [Mycobacteriaceae bacterium]
MYANTEGLHVVAEQLMAAAEALSVLAATPLTHPPLAVDEVSTSAAARLSEHGVVLGSRAADAAAVLHSAAQAIRESARAYADMDNANTSVVGLRGDQGSAQPVITPAATVNMAAAPVPITPMAPRDGEVTAAMMEAGQPDSGAGFVAGCSAHATAFHGCAVATRTAQTLMSESLIGEAGPRISVALGRFAGWADDMAGHADIVAEFAAGHKARFQTAQRNTPPTTAFTTKRHELASAQALNVRTRGTYSGVVTRLQTELMGLHTQAGAASTNYHLGELPAAPPPPPPVVPVVAPAATSSPSQQPTTTNGDGHDSNNKTRDDAATGAVADPVADALGPIDDLAADPATGTVGEAGPTIAAMLPSVLAGALGGMIGMATSIPQQLGQQVQSLASQAIQGVDGLTSVMTQPDQATVEPSDYEPSGSADDLGGAVGGGGGGTEPAAGWSALPASSGNMLTMGAPALTSSPLVGQSATSGGVSSVAAGPGGPPMFMPPMASTGAGSERSIKDPDKTIHVPAEPNSEPVKGEVVRRGAAIADDPTGENKRKPPVSVSVSARRRSIDLPKDGGDDHV